MPLRWSSLLLGLAVVLSACGGSQTVDFTASSEGEAGGAGPVSSGEVDVEGAPAPDQVPPRDARLFEGGWPEAAAFIAREVEDGNPVLVNLFASWCGPCRNEMPMLLEARDDNPDITFLGIDHQDQLEDGEGFVEELGVDFATIHDLEGEVAAELGARGMPTTVVFDADGEVAGHVVGEMTPTSLEELLAKARG